MKEIFIEDINGFSGKVNKNQLKPTEIKYEQTYLYIVAFQTSQSDKKFYLIKDLAELVNFKGKNISIHVMDKEFLKGYELKESTLTDNDQSFEEPTDNNTDENSSQNDQSSFLSGFSCLFSYLIEAIKNNDMLTAQIIINIARDFVWTWFSYDNYNYRFTTTTDEHYDLKGQWMGQQVAGLAAMVAAGLFIAAFYGVKKGVKNIPWLDIIKYVLAAAAAIYTWDRAQQLGIWVFQKAGFRPIVAALLAGFFTGTAEGPTQYAFIKLVDICKNLKNNPNAWQEFKNNPAAAFKKCGLEVILSGIVGATPGAWPGDVWQFVYAGCVAANLGPAITSTLVAVAVATFNGLTTKMNDAISAKILANQGPGYKTIINEEDKGSNCCWNPAIQKA